MRIECPLTKKSIKGSSTNNKTTWTTVHKHATQLLRR
jgi:hypothetical protein